ncbi:MAG: C40 family peptidase [Rhodobacteraceae bacterium]|jgi:cell wall-associated NlpC family hydrolase|nr:C40 family peptidase [Paracoccaceae bacterium]
MTDRRLLRAARGVAHDSLRGHLDSVRFVPGDWRRVTASLAELCAAPAGARDRQLPSGRRFCALTEAEGWIFGFCEGDGYCGWVARGDLGGDTPVTHWVASPGTHLYPAPDIKTREVMALPFGAQVEVIGQDNGFALTPLGHVPAGHLRALGASLTDPVAVARGFLGTPYLWGGNSRDGIDCSGMVQAAFQACGLPCPADSDQQAEMPGHEVPEAELRAGDLVFWTGHVAMVAAQGRLIHANAHHMAVAEEDYAGAVARIAAKGNAVFSRLRVTGLRA